MDYIDMRQSHQKNNRQAAEKAIDGIMRDVIAGIPTPNMVGTIPNEFLTDKGHIDVFAISMKSTRNKDT